MASYINDRFVNDEDAVLHVFDLSIQRGYGIFDFFRVVDGQPLYMDFHLKRFYGSARAMHLSVPYEPDQIKAIAHQLVQNTSGKEQGIRITLTGGYSANGYSLATPNLIMTCGPVKICNEADFEKGFNIITHEHIREFPEVKSINYLMAVWLQPLLVERKADDVLYHKNGIISEFPRANVFIVTHDKKLATPAKNVLPGITRRNIIELAGNVMPVEVRDISVDELMAAPEVFLASTTKLVMPIVKINDKPVGDGTPGEYSRILYSKLLQFEKRAETPVA